MSDHCEYWRHMRTGLVPVILPVTSPILVIFPVTRHFRLYHDQHSGWVLDWSWIEANPWWTPRHSLLTNHRIETFFLLLNHCGSWTTKASALWSDRALWSVLQDSSNRQWRSSSLVWTITNKAVILHLIANLQLTVAMTKSFKISYNHSKVQLMPCYIDSLTTISMSSS